MIRITIIMLTVVLFLVLSLPIALVAWIIGRFSPYTKDIMTLRVVQATFRLILWESGGTFIRKGLDNIPKDRAALFVLNHNSMFDIPITYAEMPRLTGFVSKKEMRKVPLLNMWMIFLHCQFLDRSSARAGLQTILDCIQCIKDGISICICPEGTRSMDGKLLEFKDGSFKIALKTGCPIVPIAYNHTADLFENQFPRVVPRKVVMEVGKPIDPADLTDEEKKHIGSYVRGIIQEMMDANEPLTR